MYRLLVYEHDLLGRPQLLWSRGREREDAAHLLTNLGIRREREVVDRDTILQGPTDSSVPRRYRPINTRRTC